MTDSLEDMWLRFRDKAMLEKEKRRLHVHVNRRGSIRYFDDEIIHEIRAQAITPAKVKEFAVKYNVTPESIRAIRTRKTYGSVK